MFAWTPIRAGSVVGPPSPLLQHLAGPVAERVAGLWPAPHVPFLTAPVERRHLVCLALHRAGGEPLAVEPDALLAGRLRVLIRAVVPNPPEGLARALGRLGETAWAGEDYARLLELLHCRGPAKTIRHAERIDAYEVRALAALPRPLLGGRAAGLGLTPAQAAVLAEAHAAIARLRGAEAADAAARAWRLADSQRALFEAALDDLYPEPPAPPFAGSERLRSLAGKAALRDAARRYRNCLRTVTGRAVSGQSAFYEWAGPPAAVVEIVIDELFGWRLDQARAAGNEPVPEAAREPIAAELRVWGVHVGRSAWDMESALRGACRRSFELETEQEAVAGLFGD